jgi:hypothetical protein
MTKSQISNTNNENEGRKSMPNYKKVSHISPSIKNNSSSKVPDNKTQSNAVLKFDNDDSRENDKSDFMEEINREIELKKSYNYKKSMGGGGLFQEKKRVLSIP